MFKYSVDADSIESAQYVCHLLRSHGLLYEWDCGIWPFDAQGVRVSIRSDVSGDSTKAALILTRDSSLLNECGFPPAKTWKEDGPWSYLVRTSTSNAIPSDAIPFRTAWATGFDAPADSSEILMMAGAAMPLRCIGAVSNRDGTLLNVIGIDLIGYLEERLLADHSVSCADWAEAYGQNLSQSLARFPHVDRLICLIRDCVCRLIDAAFPVVVGYYPVGQSAPMLITGDTDDATQDQLELYCSAIWSVKAQPCVIVMDFERFDIDSLIHLARSGVCFGVHPYAESGTEDEFRRRVNDLCRTYRGLFGIPPSAIRNHRFQWIGRQTNVELEVDHDVTFDLNCVAVNDQTWLGSASGVAFPIAYPPRSRGFRREPLHLPTCVEDDVFLFTLDYCYKPYLDGDQSPSSTIATFLDDCVLKQGNPAVLNLHPEHVESRTRYLLDAVLAWAANTDVWTPSLRMFGDWLEERERSRLSITVDGSEILVKVSGSSRLELLERSPQCHFSY